MLWTMIRYTSDSSQDLPRPLVYNAMRKMHGGDREIHTLIGVLPEILVRFSILNHGWIEYSKGINISFDR